jgi:hypothetical protein
MLAEIATAQKEREGSAASLFITIIRPAYTAEKHSRLTFASIASDLPIICMYLSSKNEKTSVRLSNRGNAVMLRCLVSPCHMLLEQTQLGRCAAA